MSSVEWICSDSLVAYDAACGAMEAHIDRMLTGAASERVWLLEHPPLYTTGTSADPAEISPQARLPVYRAGRGGKTTWHGPGQRVVYPMLDLRVRGRDVRAFVNHLEEWLIVTLAGFDIKGERRKDRVGIWVVHNGVEEKIAALGIRIRRWISWHGISLNVHPDLSHYDAITPCGISDYGVTSMAALGCDASLTQVDEALQKSFGAIFV